MHHGTSSPLAVYLTAWPDADLNVEFRAILNSEISDKATSNFTDTGPEVIKAKAGHNLQKKEKNICFIWVPPILDGGGGKKD